MPGSIGIGHLDPEDTLLCRAQVEGFYNDAVALLNAAILKSIHQHDLEMVKVRSQCAINISPSPSPPFSSPPSSPSLPISPSPSPSHPHPHRSLSRSPSLSLSLSLARLTTVHQVLLQHIGDTMNGMQLGESCSTPLLEALLCGAPFRLIEVLVVHTSAAHINRLNNESMHPLMPPCIWYT